MSCSSEPTLQVLIQDYFTHYLRGQKNVSVQTVSSYRDAFRIFFEFAKIKFKKTPSEMTLDDFNAENILDFLSWLEKDRGNLPKTRNLRLAGMRGFLNFVSFKVPSRVALVSRVMVIPRKRGDKVMMTYLTLEEMKAVIAAPDQSSFSGARDFVLWSLMYNTGARVSEVIGLRKKDFILAGKTGSVQIMGKGRKQRSMPLWNSTVKILNQWLSRPELVEAEAVFINRTGQPMTRSGVEDRLNESVKIAMQSCPGLENKNVSPHTIRHTTAMHLLDAGVDITVIALWLGHASPKTTHDYVEASLKMKEKALAHLQKPDVRGLRYKASDSTLAFLQSL